MKKFLLIASFMLIAIFAMSTTVYAAEVANEAELEAALAGTDATITLKGNVVISVGLYGHSGDAEVWENMDEGTLTKTKEMLDDMHKRKIDMADEIFVINVGGYIGDSTRSEINYAKEHGKIINYLEK